MDEIDTCPTGDNPEDNLQQESSKSRAEKEEQALIEKRLNCKADLKIKLLLVGSSLVGKTSLVSRFANSTADISAMKPTFPVNFHHFTVNFAERCAHIKVWDMGGAEKFHQTDMLNEFYRDIDAVMLVFAMENFESFCQLSTWLERITQHQSRSLQQLDCCLVANKSDLAAKRLVSTREATLFANHHGLPYVETSALNDDNVKKAFYDLILAVDRRRQSQVGAEGDDQQQIGAATPAKKKVRQRRGNGTLSIRALCCGCGGRGLA